MTLLSLHSIGLRSWYLLHLSIITIALSTSTILTTGDFHPSFKDMVSIQPSSNDSYTECGSIDPSTFCLDQESISGTITSVSGDGGKIMIFTLVIVTTIILVYCGIYELSCFQKFQKFRYKHLAAQLTQIKSDVLIKVEDDIDINVAVRYTTRMAYLAVWTLYLTFFVRFLNQLYSSGIGSTSASIIGTWTFGQIIAITVWAMPLLEFVKLPTQGLETGLQYRIGDMYTTHHTQGTGQELDRSFALTWN